MLRPERKLNLGQLQSWTENNFYFHGQVNRKLILKTRDSGKINLSDKDDLTEFERLFHYLRVNHLKIRE